MEELETILQKIINPESEGDPSEAFDEIRSLFSVTSELHGEEMASRDASIAEHEAGAVESAATIAALEQALVEAKAFNFDKIMSDGRNTENVDPDIPTDIPDEDDERMSYDAAFEAKEDKD